MDVDKTQNQSSEDLRKAKQLSLRHSVPPAEVPGHELQQFLGAGAYGEVWVGINLTTRRKIAVKFFLHHDAVDWSLLDRETEKMALLSSDRYVVQLLHVGWDSEPRYYVMEYVENGSLEDYLREHGALPVSEAVAIFHEIVVGLSHAHAKAVLHCDLKPANILLDEDHKPRLADFGQSRLASEQSPALGTLFYMAPEQADLNARPDVRWDVYALGAMLHTLLVGHPPHRTDNAIGKMDTAASLVERLAYYRKLINDAGVPTEHRETPGVDRALADIVDRCLASNPDDRYSTVQEVLDALNARKAARSRRPLMMLGVIGPTLLLLVMLFFGWRGYQEAFDSLATATEKIRHHAYASNKHATKYVALALGDEIDEIFRIAEMEAHPSPDADNYRFLQLVESVNEVDLTKRLSSKEGRVHNGDPDLIKFRNLPETKSLEEHLNTRLKVYLQSAKHDPSEPHLSSMFVINEQGLILAAAYADGSPTKSAGKQYRHRTYFNGLRQDLDSDSSELWSGSVQPISGPFFSAPFQSTTSKKWKVGISDRFDGGILVITVNLGEFASLQNQGSNTEDPQPQIATIIYARPESADRGTILQHPHLENLLTHESASTLVNYRVSAEMLDALESRSTSKQSKIPATTSEKEHNAWDLKYFDPMAQAPDGGLFEGPWIATAAPVEWRSSHRVAGANSQNVNQTDLLVMLQEREESLFGPVNDLKAQLFREAPLAGLGFLLTVLVMWYAVWRVSYDPKVRRRRPAAPTLHTSIHQRATVPAADEKVVAAKTERE